MIESLNALGFHILSQYTFLHIAQLYINMKYKQLGQRPLMLSGTVDWETATKYGAQWLSGRVLDSRPRGRGFEPHQHHCVVVLEQDTFILA